MKISFAIALSLAVLCTPAAALADEWAPPRSRVFASKWGSQAFKVLAPKFGGPSEGVLFRLDDQGKEVIVWQKMLVNTPYRVLVPDAGKGVVTIDTYGNLGYKHVLVVYDEKGNVLKDYKLEDLLTADEIMNKVKRTVSSRHWSQETQFSFEGKDLVVRLSWGRTLRINVHTGQIGK